MYQRVFQSENIGFGKPSLDECDVCAKYRTHCKDLSGAHDVNACKQCKVGQDHKKKAEGARTNYCEDRDKVTVLRINSSFEKVHVQYGLTKVLRKTNREKTFRNPSSDGTLLHLQKINQEAFLA